MTFRRKRLSLALIAEERVGAPRYWDAVAKREAEDKSFEAAKRAGVPDGVR